MSLSDIPKENWTIQGKNESATSLVSRVMVKLNKCLSSVKIRHIGQINEDALVFEFATDEDKRFYRQAGEIGQDVEFVIVE